MVMTKIVYTYNELIELIENKYDNPDTNLIRRAYDMAEKAHRGEKRLTGHAYVTHPLAAAYKLAEMGLHLNVVAAGLLHDVVEDTGITLEDVENEFGADVASLVDSVTKLKKVKYQGVERYIENLRKMFLAMASDVRVVFIKFADRLHNMQTLYAQSKEKQKRTAKEVLEIYAPIAGRLGMHEFKSELEDLSFAYLKPKEYERMRSIMETKVKEKSGYIEKEISKIETMLDEKTDITDYEVYGRVKKLYSLYQKLQRHDNDLSKIYDFIAIRVIVDDVEECYAALGLTHQKWRPLAGRIKDYIAQPKPNGYQSIHTTVFADEGEIIEIQIRTQEMHALAEYGVAAHWRYKQHGSKKTKNVKWMEELAELHKELDDKKKFLEKLEAMKIDVFKDRIFVFTPKGDVIDLPEAATPVDFAYQIHSEVGNTCSGARVNDKMANLDTALHSGDVVQIITDDNRRGPNPDWLKFVKTRHAKKEIKEATKHSVKGWLNKVMQGRDQAKHQND
jgi:GTP pyrophosphokinase